MLDFWFVQDLLRITLALGRITVSRGRPLQLLTHLQQTIKTAQPFCCRAGESTPFSYLNVHIPEGTDCRGGVVFLTALTQH